MNDKIDAIGHTVDQAKRQQPLLDADAPAASQEQPRPGGNVMVPAQTQEEVQAQIDNFPGREGETHDQEEQMDRAAKFGAGDDDEGDPDEGDPDDDQD